MNNLEKFKKFAASERCSFSEKKNAIIYTRVSTKEQAENNTSLSTQKKYCEIYAKNNGFNIVGYFGGTHESAKSDERKEFQRMLKYAKQNKTVGYIIVYSYDRFSRTGSSAAYITNELLKHGIQVKAVTQEVNTLSASGKLQQNMLYIFSQFDNELRRDKTITAMTDLLRKGYWCWKPPRGYINKQKFKKVVDWDIAISKEGELLKKAFKWRVNRTYTNAEISRKLNEMGMKINEKRLLEIFKNPFYCGIIVCKMIPGEVIQGRHPKIVSEEDFLKINIPSAFHPKTHTKGNEALPLKQFIFCARCNERMTGFLVKAKGIYYYKCRTEGCHSCKSAKKMHNLFINEFQELTIKPQYMDYIQKVMIGVFDRMTNDTKENESLLKKQKTEVKNKLNKLEERFAIGEIDREIYEKFASKYKAEIIEIEEKYHSPSISSSNLEKALEKAFNISPFLSEIWSSGDLIQKESIQRLVFPAGIGYDKESDRVQTFRTNAIFAAIPLLKREAVKQKSGDPINFNQISARVTS